MAKWTNDLVLDNGLSWIGSSVDKMYLIKAYTPGDSYATVVGNKVAEVAMTSGDVPISDGAVNGRTVTVAAKNAITLTASTGTTPNLHIALVKAAATSTVLAVTDETTNQEMASGIEVNIPSWTINISDPA